MTGTLPVTAQAADLAHRTARWLNTTNGTSQQELILRVLKVCEEVGEVCETVDIHETRTDDTVRELVDVIITAMTAQASLGYDPHAPLQAKRSWAAFAGTLTVAAVELAAVTGRLAAAVIGWTGQNPRKGRTHTTGQVCEQLGEVVHHAIVMISMCGANPTEAIHRGATKVHARLDAMGVAR